ncbi:uncharacterized protein [Dermacentor andersoni]|uniref:uncharacterized protein isoform X1 n=1 Tax=Dermacentor andersoni TaxID=34620 RepID=UPI003B3BD02E
MSDATGGSASSAAAAAKRAARAEAQRRRRQNPEVRAAEAEAKRRRREEVRAAEAEARRRRRREDPAFRAAEADSRRRRRENAEVRAVEAEANCRRQGEVRAAEAEARRSRRRREDPEFRAAEAEARRRRRQNAEVRAAEAEAKRRRREDPEVRAAEAEARRRRRREDLAVRAAEAETRRKAKLAKTRGATKKSQRQFRDNLFEGACSVCGRLWFQNDLKLLPDRCHKTLQREFPNSDLCQFRLCSMCMQSLRKGDVTSSSHDQRLQIPPEASTPPRTQCVGEALPAADGVKARRARVHRTERRWPLVTCPHHSTSAAGTLRVATADFSAVFPDIDFKQAVEAACDKAPFIEASLASTTCRVEPWRGLQDKCVGECEALLQHAEQSCQTEHHITLVRCTKPQVSTCSVEVQADPWWQHHCGIQPIGVDLCET